MHINSAVILAGGKGTRFKELTDSIPKPMIKLLKKPLLLHIINHYVAYDIKNIYVLTGYKHNYIVDYFSKNYKEIKKNTYEYKNESKIYIQNTGLNTMTGGRIKRVIDEINEDNFYLTYGDGLSDVNIDSLRKHFIRRKTIATVTAVRPPARFGSLSIQEGKVMKFGEKNQTSEGWINGGYFVLNKAIKKYLRNDEEIFEKYPLEKLAKLKNLSAYKHRGFWQCVDTIRELELLEKAVKEKELVLFE